jgi:hypothetical protein
MSHDFMLFLQTLTSRLDIANEEISLDADIVAGLRNSGAILTMKNVSNFDEPEILVNDEEDDAGVVSGLSYDQTNHIITFNAAHFTSFKAVEKGSNGSRPKITDVDTYQYKNSSGNQRIKVTIEGKRFNKKAKVRLANKKPIKVKRISSHKIVAYFSVEKVKRSSHNLYVKVINPGGQYDRFKDTISLKD